jgi:hypothetical protein
LFAAHHAARRHRVVDDFLRVEDITEIRPLIEKINDVRDGSATGGFASQRAANHLTQKDVARRWARKKNSPSGGQVDALGQHFDIYEYHVPVADEEAEATTAFVEVRDEVPGYLGHPSPNRVS